MTPKRFPVYDQEAASSRLYTLWRRNAKIELIRENVADGDFGRIGKALTMQRAIIHETANTYPTTPAEFAFKIAVMRSALGPVRQDCSQSLLAHGTLDDAERLLRISRPVARVHLYKNAN